MTLLVSLDHRPIAAPPVAAGSDTDLRARRAADSLFHALGAGFSQSSADDSPVHVAELRRHADQFTRLRLSAGSYLFRGGDFPSDVHVVVSGQVQLRSRGPRGRLLVQLLREGDVLGDASALTHAVAPFDAMVSEDAELLRIPSVDLVALLARDPEVARWWMTSMVMRLNVMQRRVIQVLAGEPDVALVRLLLDEAVNGEVRASQEELAQMLGAHRTTINRCLKALEAAGLVELGYRRVWLLDRARLVEAGNGTDLGRAAA